MKIKSFIYSGICALALVGTGCTDETKYTPGTPDSNAGAFFPAEETSDIELVSQQQEFFINLCRSNAAEEIVVPITTNAPSEFTVPQSVNFAAGQDMAQVKVAVNFAAIVPNKVYDFAIQIAPENASTYGISTLNVSVQYAPWSEWVRLGGNNEFGTYTYNNPFVSGDEQASVYMRTSLDNPDQLQYRIGDYEVAGVAENDQTALTMMGYAPYNMVIEYNKATGAVIVPNTNCVTQYQNSPIHAACCYTFGTQIKPSFIEGVDPDKVLAMSKYDSEKGRFALMMVYFTESLSFNSGNKYEYLQLPGFEQYNLEVSLNGQYTSAAGETMQVFNIAMSENIANVKYDVYAGTATAAQAEEAAEALAGNEEAKSVTASGNVAVTLEDGDYTVVVAGTDASGKFVAWNYLTFDYSSNAVDPNEGWTSLGDVLYGEDYIAGLYGIEVTNYVIEAQSNDETAGLYRLVDPYGEAWPFQSAFLSQGLLEYTAAHNYLEFMLLGGDYALVVNTEMNFSLEGDPVAMGSIAYNNIAGGKPLQDQIDAGLMGKFENNVMTMPVKSLIQWLGAQGYYGNINGGFQINFAPDEEEEEEAAYSMKNLKKFASAVRKASVNRIDVRRAAEARKSMVIDNKTWFDYRGNKISAVKITL